MLHYTWCMILYWFIADGTNDGDEPKETDDDKKRQKRGGKGLSKPKKKDGGPKKISLSVAPRGRKRLTCVVGLKSYGKFIDFMYTMIIIQSFLSFSKILIWRQQLNSLAPSLLVVHQWRETMKSSSKEMWKMIYLTFFLKNGLK